jgi:glycosyltransferase involved in cell wall biosynthesis
MTAQLSKPAEAAVVARPMRIAHLTTVDLSLAKLLRTELAFDVQMGHQVFAMSSSGPYIDEIEALGVTHVAIPGLTRSWDLRSDLRAIGQLWRNLRDLHLDVLHTHTPKAGILGRIIGRIAGIPVVVNTCHGLVATQDDPWTKRFAVYGLEWLATLFSHAELFQNPEDLQVMARIAPRRSSTLVGNGTDLDTFQFDASERARLRQEFGVPEGGILVGAVGRRVAEKGLLEFAAVGRHLQEVATFIWVGPHDLGKSDAVNGVVPGVRFIGERSDMPSVYSALDIFVLPSHREGFPRSAMEAAACGRAIVLTDIRGCREIGIDGTNVLFVRPRDDESLAAAIQVLIQDAGLRDRLGSAARLRALQAFDQRAVAAQSLRTYSELLSDRRRSPNMADLAKSWASAPGLIDASAQGGQTGLGQA